MKAAASSDACGRFSFTESRWNYTAGSTFVLGRLVVKGALHFVNRQVSVLYGQAYFGTVFDAVDLGICVIEVLFEPGMKPVDYRFLQVNAAFAEQTGLHGAVGKTMREFAPRHEQYWFDDYGRVALTGQPLRAESEAAALGRWYEVNAQRVGDPARHHVAVMFRDITQRKRQQEQILLLSGELKHRAQNMIAVISSTIRLTKADTIEEFKSALLGRIVALGHSQKLLAQSPDRVIDIASLIGEEISVYGAGEASSIQAVGPSVHLQPTQAQAIAMIIHELLTNAAKYGALSNGAGTVRITWTKDGENLALAWEERGGPPVVPPQRRGFGTKVVEACARNGSVPGDVTFDWRPEGLLCRLRIRLATAEADEGGSPQAEAPGYPHDGID